MSAQLGPPAPPWRHGSRPTSTPPGSSNHRWGGEGSPPGWGGGSDDSLGQTEVEGPAAGLLREKDRSRQPLTPAAQPGRDLLSLVLATPCPCALIKDGAPRGKAAQSAPFQTGKPRSCGSRGLRQAGEGAGESCQHGCPRETALPQVTGLPESPAVEEEVLDPGLGCSLQNKWCRTGLLGLIRWNR